MKENKGCDLLIPRDRWVDKEKIQGDEMKTLTSPLIEEAFQRILELHKPKHDIALISLCTTTRPYSKSRKWKAFIENFGDKADLIICSNGGIIPIEFESCYPYLTYDAHGNAKYDKFYINVCYRRLMRFFEVFEYKKIVFDFRPKLRNRLAALAFKRDYKGAAEIVIVPTVEAYEKAKKTGFKPAGQHYPDMSAPVMAEIKNEIK